VSENEKTSCGAMQNAGATWGGLTSVMPEKLVRTEKEDIPTSADPTSTDPTSAALSAALTAVASFPYGQTCSSGIADVNTDLMDTEDRPEKKACLLTRVCPFDLEALADEEKGGAYRELSAPQWDSMVLPTAPCTTRRPPYMQRPPPGPCPTKSQISNLIRQWISCASEDDLQAFYASSCLGDAPSLPPLGGATSASPRQKKDFARELAMIESIRIEESGDVAHAVFRVMDTHTEQAVRTYSAELHHLPEHGFRLVQAAEI